MEEFDVATVLRRLRWERQTRDDLIEAIIRVYGDPSQTSPPAPIKKTKLKEIPDVETEEQPSSTRKRWTEEELEELWAMYKDEKTADDMAEHFGRDKTGIYVKLHKLRAEHGEAKSVKKKSVDESEADDKNQEVEEDVDDTVVVDSTKIINGPEVMTKNQMFNFLLQNGNQVSKDMNSGAIFFHGERLSARELLNITNAKRAEQKKAPVTLIPG